MSTILIHSIKGKGLDFLVRRKVLRDEFRRAVELFLHIARSAVVRHGGSMLARLKKITPLRRLYYRQKMRRPGGQSDEAQILQVLTTGAARTFVEFGFHPAEFNCAALARSPEWSGLLIDGSARQVEDARALLPSRIEAVQQFLTLENLDMITSKMPKIGVLSIDIDGNDYWFLEALIGSRPDVISVEYNASFGLEPISVPYDPAFDRLQKHRSGWYHGASLTGLAGLCSRHGYGLAAVSKFGTNAFFTRSGRLDPAKNWRPNALRDRWSNSTANEQWQELWHMPFARV